MNNSPDKYMTVGDAISIKNRINVSVKKTKHKLILLCQKNIQFAASKNKEDTIWTVPTFMIDSICYNVTVMTLLIASHFVEKGFYAKMLGTNSIYISWRNTNGIKLHNIKIIEKSHQRSYVRKCRKRVD